MSSCKVMSKGHNLYSKNTLFLLQSSDTPPPFNFYLNVVNAPVSLKPLSGKGPACSDWSALTGTSQQTTFLHHGVFQPQSCQVHG